MNSGRNAKRNLLSEANAFRKERDALLKENANLKAEIEAMRPNLVPVPEEPKVSSEMSAELKELIRRARRRPPNAAQLREQRISWAYGEARFAGMDVTREYIEKISDEVCPAEIRTRGGPDQNCGLPQGHEGEHEV